MIHSIIFFDQNCSLCRRTINFLAQQNKKKLFKFAPIDGSTAEKMLNSNLAHLRGLNTVILLEHPDGKIWLRGRAVFRVLWLLGGWWRCVGWLYQVPFVDLFYKFIAKHRKKGEDLPPLSVHLLP
jgi:predicted DCC family thiol-disulfide oxidoreductase YuxK